MDEETRKKLGGTVTKIAVSYERKVSDGNYGSVGGTFFVEADVAPDTNPDQSADALYEWVKAAAVRNLKASLDAVKPKEAPHPAEDAGEPIAPAPAPRPAPAAPEQAPLPAPTPATTGGVPEGAQKVLDIAADDTVQLKVTDSQKKMLLFKVGIYKKHGITCWPEVAQTWSELADCWGWQVAQPYYVTSFGIRQIVVGMKQSTNDPSKQVPDKVLVIR
jgi:hypothetical protein